MGEGVLQVAGEHLGKILAVDDDHQFGGARQAHLLLVVHGPAAHCRERIQQYMANGVTTPAIALMTQGDPAAAIRSLVLK
ncbi:hypothetical protein AB0L88_29660 [Saccharopolyspora shandongensis]|uniref:Uncharacterized protein n=1 Tax=Saccharopolyspora shandongensis TaxID=418495 RepID=A0A1H3NSN6_9PSEU|nr:hypothetical protein [Saccharopolyspora shandongensis]SDY91763.1 hypothetical protein SAMN05216215_10398 [Saccharopolyspora shandongensis]